MDRGKDEGCYYRNKPYPITSNLLVGELFSRQPERVRFTVSKGSLPVYGRPIEAVVKYEDRIEVMLGELAIAYTASKFKNDVTSSATVTLRGTLEVVSIGIQEDDEFSQLWLNEE